MMISLQDPCSFFNEASTANGLSFSETSPGSGSGIHPLSHESCIGMIGNKALHVTASAEGPTFPGDHQHADVGIVAYLFERGGKAEVDLLAEGVAPIGTVERQHSNVAVDVSDQMVGSGTQFTHVVLPLMRHVDAAISVAWTLHTASTGTTSRWSVDADHRGEEMVHVLGPCCGGRSRGARIEERLGGEHAEEEGTERTWVHSRGEPTAFLARGDRRCEPVDDLLDGSASESVAGGVVAGHEVSEGLHAKAAPGRIGR